MNDGKPVTLSLWAYEGYQDFLPALIKGFEKKYPNIHVSVTNLPEAQYTTKVQTALAAGKPPDLGFIYTNLWLKENQFLPLENVIKAAHIDLKQWAPGIIGRGGTNEDDACSYQGKVYCLGSYTGTDMLFYNKDMLAQAGVPAPAPWPAMNVDQYAKLACTLKSKLGGVYGTANGDPITWLPWSIVVSKNGRTATGVANSPSTARIYQTVASLIQKHCAPSLNVLDPWQQGVDYFAEKKLAMVITDYQSLAKIEKAGINYGVTAPPAPPGGRSFFNEWTDNIGVFRDSPHADAAELFVAYQATVGQRLRVQVTHDLPVSVAAAKKYNWARHIPGREEVLKILPHAEPNVFVPDRWDIASPLFDAFGSIVSGGNAQQVLNDATPKFQQKLDQAWNQWDNGG